MGLRSNILHLNKHAVHRTASTTAPSLEFVFSTKMALGYVYKIGNGLWIFLFECAVVSVGLLLYYDNSSKGKIFFNVFFLCNTYFICIKFSVNFFLKILQCR